MASPTTKRLRSSIDKQEVAQRPATMPDEILEALDKADLAELSSVQISRMTCDELIRVVRATQLPLLRPETDEHLEFYDRPTLERLVYLVRRCCRKQGFQSF